MYTAWFGLTQLNIAVKNQTNDEQWIFFEKLMYDGI